MGLFKSLKRLVNRSNADDVKKEPEKIDFEDYEEVDKVPEEVYQEPEVKPEVKKERPVRVDHIGQLKKALYDECSPETARTYFSTMNAALESQWASFMASGKIDTDKLLEYAKTLKNRNRVSKLKSACKIVLKNTRTTVFFIELKEIHESKPKFRRRRHKTFKLATAVRKINNIKNKKLQIAYKLMLLTGLRVDEAANITKKDIEFEKGTKRKNSKLEYVINVIGGKGGKDRSLYGIQDDYLIRELQKLVEPLNDSDKIFFSANYMQKVAKKNGFHCHQLRRAFAQIVYYNYDVELDTLLELLGHAKETSTYKKYINYPVNFYGTRWHNIRAK
jgi:integrase